MFPIFADSFMIATRLSEPATPDYSRLHPARRRSRHRQLPRLWFWLS